MSQYANLTKSCETNCQNLRDNLTAANDTKHVTMHEIAKQSISITEKRQLNRSEEIQEIQED